MSAGGQVLVALVLATAMCRVATGMVLDDFERLTGWSAVASPGAHVEMARDAGRTGTALRIDFDLGAGGHVIVHKAFSLTLPANYAFTFGVRGEALPNNLEFKLVDRSGKNVWWYNQRGFRFSTDWRQVTIKQPRIEFAWGPAGPGVLEQVGAIEFAIAAGDGGKGSVWIDDLRLEERKASALSEAHPTVSASTSLLGHEPEHLFDRNVPSGWRSGSPAADQWVRIDFGEVREYGGLVIDWDAEDYATAYEVEVSDDGQRWTSFYTSTKGNGGHDYIYMPDGESRYIRLALQHSSRDHGYGIRALTVKPFEFSASPNQFFEAIASDAPLGTYPKYFSRKQTYWTVIGVNGDDKEALLNEEGMLEVDQGAFSIEPFLYTDGTLVTWNTVHTKQELEQGYLPIPSVLWHSDTAVLSITAFAAGTADASTLFAIYRVENPNERQRDIDLFLAIRPFQVVPPWQSLNMVGGVTPIRELAFDGRAVWVNREKAVLALSPPAGFGAATFDEGPITDFLAHDTVPLQSQVADSFGYASGVLRYRLSLSPGEHQEIYIAIPFHDSNVAHRSNGSTGPASYVTTQREETARYWESMLGHVGFELPAGAAPVTQTLKTTLAYILINRDGPAIQPGSRTYARSWIRDGAMTSTALLEMGFTDEVRDFIRWFAGYQLADGRIPCCVDRRGADPVPEYDSDGEFVYAVAEYYRYTHDLGFLKEMWPAVVRAVASIAALRQQRTTPPFKHGNKRAFYGLLPESISHEGYSVRPVHSYWDDFFALRGLKDAAAMAVVVGDDEHAASFAALRDAFRRDLYASISLAIAAHKIDYIPGSVELGDFDATSTAIALTVAGEQSALPQPALTQTFDRYYAHVQERQRSAGGADGYTPYELRNVAAFVRLGQRARALEVLDQMLADQRPRGWNEWQEVVWRDPTAPRFIGDMPHTWIGSTYIQAVRSLFAYDRESDHALVIAAGLPAAWVMSESGVAVKRLPTHYGLLSYSLRSEGSNILRLRLSGDLILPPGRVVIQPPLPQPLRAVTVNGRPTEKFTTGSATIGEFPADVVLEY